MISEKPLQLNRLSQKSPMFSMTNFFLENKKQDVYSDDHVYLQSLVCLFVLLNLHDVRKHVLFVLYFINVSLLYDLVRL